MDLALPTMPPEIWDQIAQYLSPISLLAAAESFGFNISEERAKHARLWSAIFRDDSWADLICEKFNLHLILVGPNLGSFNSKTTTPQNLGLIVRYASDDRPGNRTELWKHATHFYRSLKECQIQPCGIRFVHQDVILHCAGEIIKDPGEENLRVPSPASLFKETYHSLTSSFASWNSLGGYKCNILGVDHIAGGSGKSREVSDVQDIVAVGLGPWLDAHFFVEQIEFTDIARFHALYSLSRAWKHLPKYCKSSWVRDEEVGGAAQGTGPGDAWIEDLNPGFLEDSPELQDFQQSFLRSFLDHFPCGLVKGNSERVN
ncbi:hypothetical protein BKA65DRAFT_125772 [Rhexocercosporidium sp. MPI-PUGE-AT-0058]|nr:hypothetical protein BKA65DRAFT_125772 [Rhexocercosporidium sp. MPI-PUGE-AT-0058]